MKKLFLILFFIPFISYGQVINNTNNNTISVGEKSLPQMFNEANKAQGMVYLGNGICKVTQVGSSGFVSLKKLYKRCTEQITLYANRNNLTFKEINREEQKTGYAVWPKVTMTYKLFNKDGSVALNKADAEKLKDKAKKEFIELKEFLDLGLITQEEFDEKANVLKKVLLGN